MTRFLDICYNAIKLQATAIPETLRNVGNKDIYTIKDKRLIFVGCGDSYAVGEYGKWAFLRANHDSLVCSSSELQQIILDENTVVIGITASGRSLETIAALEYAQENDAVTVVLTDNEEGAACDCADYTWLTKSGVETYNTSPSAPTTSAMAYLLKLAVTEQAMPRTRIHNDMHVWEQNANAIVSWAESAGKEISLLPKPGEMIYNISEGANYMAAQLGMMKFNEYSLVKGTSALREEFRHHYNLSIRGGEPVVFITDTPLGDRDETYLQILIDTLKMRAYHLHTPHELHLESPLGQTIANTIALQMAAFHHTRRHNPEMDKFKLPNAEAFKIY
ncbi:MAG: SIS domain-containing protein [Candidatus Thorarchaeota archaeon]|jgi:glucosamine 6-phosphate synthetase-like amidotransferase/phosphosugar isomerase protein